MTSTPFQVSDKVQLRPGWQDTAPVVPRLRLGRVYCVEHAYTRKSIQYVRLVGIRRDRRANHLEAEANILAMAFMPAGSTTNCP